ncbi:MAG: T9SS type A sorting domain-containing protein [Flavobacteriales bacterium]|jgi:hypothetical protein|nr:T9SS type A sorting domain-containing protein [Flavobacteriales bacterium]
MKNLWCINSLGSFIYNKGIKSLCCVFLLFVGELNAQVYKKDFTQYKSVRKIIKTYDGGLAFITTGQAHNDDGKLVKLDAQGNFLWEINPNIGDTLLMNGLAELSNGDLIVVGETHKYWNPFAPKTFDALDGVMAKINTCGEVEWTKLIVWNDTIKMADPIRNLVVDDQDNIWIHHYIVPSFNYLDKYFEGAYGVRLDIKKFDSDGDLLEQMDEYLETPENADISDMEFTSDGGVIVTGDGYHFPYYNQVQSDTNNTVTLRPFTMKVDDECEVEWTYTHKWEEDEYKTPDKYYSEVFELGTTRTVNAIDDSTYLFSSQKIWYNSTLSRNVKLINFYVLNQQGQRLRDTVFYTPHHGFGFHEVIKKNDSTHLLCVSVCDFTKPINPSNGYRDYYIEIFEINPYTLAFESVYIDSTHDYLNTEIVLDNQERLWIGANRQDVGQLTAEFQILDAHTYQPLAFPTTDSNAYDTLCPTGFIPGVIDLPDDTTTYTDPFSVADIEKSTIKVCQSDAHTLFFEHEYDYLDFKVVDASGRTVMNQTNYQNNSLSIGHLSRGVYYFTITLPSGSSFGHTVVRR